jgi:NADH oxidase (H2O2-forming)
MSERLIVIGGGGAGIAAATTAKRLDPEMQVTLFTEFEDVAYSPCGIPFVYGGEIPKFEDLFLSTVQRYRDDGLDMRMETAVTEIDLDRRVVTARNQHEGFDKLIVCTGFQWEKPDVPGANLDGLHYIKNIRKAMEFDKVLESVKTAVVVGATPLGVEMAGNLGHRGIETHFVDEGPWALSEVLDPDVAEPVHESLEKRGVVLHMGTRVERFVGKGKVTARSRATWSSCACTSSRTRRLRPRPGSLRARPAAWSSTSACARTCPACGRRATSSRCRTG